MAFKLCCTATPDEMPEFELQRVVGRIVAADFDQTRTRADMLLEIGERGYVVAIRQGRIEAVRPVETPVSGWDFAILGTENAWAEFWQPMPKPRHHDLIALIREGKMHHIPNIMITAKKQGNQLLNEELEKLVRETKVTYEEALSKAIDKPELAKRFGREYFDE